MSTPESAMSAGSLVRSRTCLFCGVDDSAVVFAARLPQRLDKGEVLHYQYQEVANQNVWHYRVVRCKRCGHTYANPISDERVVEESYLQQDHDNRFGLDDELLLRTNRGYAAIVRPHLPAPDKRLLQVDVGCDTGNFLKATRDMEFRRVVGIEPGVDSANQTRTIPGVEVWQKLFAPADFLPRSVDFLSLIHVLDHLVEPRQIIREIKPLMSEQGVVLAVVHNIGSLIARVSRERWPVINLVHFDYFARTSLRRIFEIEGYRMLGVYGTKNYFPVHHLIRFAPFIPAGLRAALIQTVQRPPLKRVILGLRLGNIAVLAAAK